MPRIRVLYLIPSLIQGGAQRHVVDLVANLDGGRFDVAICTVRPGVHYAQELPKGEPRFPLNRTLFSPQGLFAIVRTIRRFNPDVLHVHLNDGNLLGRLATRLAPVPVVVTSVHLDDLNFGYRIAERILCHRTDRIIAVSRGVQDFLVGKVRVPADRVQIVVNGVDPARFVPADAARRAAGRLQFGIPADAQVALMPSRICAQKNQDLMVETLGRLKKVGDLPADFLLLLAGNTSSRRLERKVRRLTNEYELESQVRLLGPIKDMQSLYWASDMIFMPSRSEGSSIAAFEGMSSGLPVLISDRENTDGVIIDGENGWQVPANDGPALETTVRQILRTPAAERRTGGLAGRRRIQKQFTLKRVAQDMETLYESLLASRPDSFAGRHRVKMPL